MVPAGFFLRTKRVPLQKVRLRCLSFVYIEANSRCIVHKIRRIALAITNLGSPHRKLNPRDGVVVCKEFAEVGVVEVVS